MTIVPANAIAIDTISTDKLTNLQEKVAKGYSSKFCNGIGMGISKEGATRLTINENSKSKFNPSLWFELASSGEKNLDQIDQDQLAEIISMQIIEDCGYALNLSGQKGVEQFKDYFISIRDEVRTD